MMFGGSAEPCCIVKLLSVGGLGEEANRKCADEIGKLMNEVIGVPKERTFVEFIDQNKHYIARNGDTLHMLAQPTARQPIE